MTDDTNLLGVRTTQDKAKNNDGKHTAYLLSCQLLPIFGTA
jgi:hypothetical protein